MIARGRLVGALVLGPKRSGESYAPDESHAMMHLAHSVGGALAYPLPLRRFYKSIIYRRDCLGAPPTASDRHGVEPRSTPGFDRSRPYIDELPPIGAVTVRPNVAKGTGPRTRVRPFT